MTNNNYVITFLRTNQSLVRSCLNKIKTTEHGNNHALCILTEEQFKRLYRELSALGINPYLIINWTELIK